VLNGIVATSVLPNLVGSIVGATALVVGVWLTAYYAKNLDARRHREQLVSEAFSDFVRAIARSGFARDHIEQRDALLLAAHAKARLVAYGDVALVAQIQHFDENGADTSKPECQAAIAAIAQGLRSTNEAPGVLSDDEVKTVLFGDEE
jgi:hypothetical protein